MSKFAIEYRRAPWDVAFAYRKPQTFDSLNDAAQAREFPGDLVINATTGEVIADTRWLWLWEKLDINSYAHRAVAWAKQPRA